MQKVKNLVKFCGIAYLLSLGACSVEDFSSFRGLAGKKKKVEDGENQDEDIAGDEEEQNRFTRRVDNSGASFQVKDVSLLRSSIDSCMGPDMLVVSAEMLLPPGTGTLPALGDNKIRFLLPTQYVDGDDVLDKERGNMVDQGSSVRTGISADSLTDTYLRSLETVANVIAHNCTADRQECQCSTKDLARDMLTRCLPGLDPETQEMDDAAEMLGLVCADGTKGMRKAIASMLSSYAFASAR